MSEDTKTRRAGNKFGACVLAVGLVASAVAVFLALPRFKLVTDRGVAVWRLDQRDGTTCRTQWGWNGWDCVPEKRWSDEKEAEEETLVKLQRDQEAQRQLSRNSSKAAAISDELRKGESSWLMPAIHAKLARDYATEYESFLSRMHLNDSPAALARFISDEVHIDGRPYRQIADETLKALLEMAYEAKDP